jgi:uncharacterized membrane protein
LKLKYTKLQIALEIIGLLLLIAMFAFVCIQWNQLPLQIPVHYNATGEIDSLGSKTEILIMPVIGIFLYVLLTVVAFFPQIWNVPVRITKENKEAVYQHTMNLIILLKIEMLAMFFYITYYMATMQPLPITFIPILMIILFGTIIFYILRTSRLGTRKE